MLRHLRTIFLLILVPAVGWYAGLLRPVEEGPRLLSIATDQARTCVEDAGVRYPEEEIDIQALRANDRAFSAYDRCWSDVARDPRFRELKLVGPSELQERARSDGFAAWRCVERHGYRRRTPIPLSGSDGHPLTATAGHFDVAASEQALVRFYSVVARCDNRSLDSLRGPDGTFSRELADGSDCVDHEHGGSRHSHGCYWAGTNRGDEE